MSMPPFVCFSSQAVSLLLGNDQFQRPVDGLRFGAGTQDVLCALDLDWIQKGGFVRPII
jgi:hypothetical protein